MLKGQGVQQNLTEAARLFQLSADRHYNQAQYQYAMCLKNGLGVPINLDEAARYKLAADKGHTQA